MKWRTLLYNTFLVLYTFYSVFMFYINVYIFYINIFSRFSLYINLYNLQRFSTYHHHAVGREATKTASITWLLLSIYLSAMRVISLSRYLCLSASDFFWWDLWTGHESGFSFCNQKTVGSREPALVACLVTSSWGVQSTGDSFWSEDLP